MQIVVIGGTGLIGSKVVEKLKQRGHDAVAAAPSTDVNTITGEGLAGALSGAQVLVSERALVPGSNAHLGATTFDWWLTHAPPPPKR